MKFVISARRGREVTESITVFYSDGATETIPDNHANFAELRDYLLTDTDADETHVRQLARFAASIAAELAAVSPRFALAGNRITFNGEKLRKGISKHIMRMYRAGDDNWKSVVRFLERLSHNPSELARENAFAYLAAHDVTLTPDGQLILYKGVKSDSGSIHTGAAYVDGKLHHGSIPNPVGAVVSMPRDMVNPDRAIGCSHGLHAGTWTYASGFAQGMTLKVLVHPRDIVSVPEDCAEQKVRVSRYRVLEATVQEIAESTYDVFMDGSSTTRRTTTTDSTTASRRTTATASGDTGCAADCFG